MTNPSKLYICHTPYHLLVSCLKELTNADSSIASLVLMDSLGGFEEYEKRVVSSRLFVNVVNLKHTECFTSWTNSSFYKSLLWLKVSPLAKRNFAFILDTPEVFIFNDQRDMGAVLHHFKKSYHLLEDGCDCFKRFNQQRLHTANHPLIRRLLKRLLNVPISMGDSQYCIDIELNSADGLASRIDKPVVVNEKKSLIDSLDSDDLSTLRSIFPVPQLETTGSTALILTSPPEAHGRDWTEGNQRDYYQSIIAQCSQDVVFLKPHPRDLTDYDIAAKGVVMVPRELPVETLDILTNRQFDVGICYMSTALDQLSCCKEKTYLVD